MNVTIHAVNIPVTRSIRGLIEKQLRFALRRYDDHLQKIVVRLSNEGSNSDVRCHIQARIPGQSDVVIDHTGRNLYAAIYRSVGRASSTILRRVKRQQSKSRQRPSLALAAS